MKALATLGLVLVLAACSGSGESGGASPVRDRPSTSTQAPAPPAADELAGTDVCGLVREGIDAFNVGDLEQTVATFRGAVGPAEDLARDQPSDGTRALLEAVRYYAALPAEEYAEASQSSPEFLRHKDFTLSACAYAGPPEGATPPEPAIPA